MPSLKKRLFVGNLPCDLPQSAVEMKLGKFGNVLSVEMKQKSDFDGNALSSFAFVDIETDLKNLDNCFKYFENELWHKQKVKVELAKESFLERLRREQSTNYSHGSHSRTQMKAETCDYRITGRICDVPRQIDIDIRNEESDCVKARTVLKEKAYYSCGTEEEAYIKPSLEVGYSVGLCPEEEGKIKNNILNEFPQKKSGLPMFSGTGLIKGLARTVESDSECVYQFTGGKCMNDGGTKGFVTSNRNLPMFCGTKLLINSEPKLPSISANDDDDAGTPVRISHKVSEACGTRALLNSELLSSQGLSPNSARHKRKSKHNRCESNCIKIDASSTNIKDESADCSHSPHSQKNLVKESSHDLNTVGKVKKAYHSEVVSPSVVMEEKIKPKEGKKFSKEKNDLLAERKRLNAVEERKKAFAMQKEAVKKALSAIDMKNPQNKKIVFDDDDQESQAQDNAEKCNIKCEVTKPKLFEDSSDDEDVKDLGSTEFKIKPQFEGRQGQKLLDIQSRYGNDSRFNLDERFLESDQEDEENSNEDAQNHLSLEDLSAEKDHQLSILQDMLGVDISTKRIKRDKTDKRDSLQMVRFDPSNPEHSKYLVSEEDLKKKVKGKSEKKMKKQDEKSGPEESSKKVKVEEEAVPVVMERFYKVSDKLKESLKKQNKKLMNKMEEDDGECAENRGGFSLLKKYGSPPSDDEVDNVEYSTKAITVDHMGWGRNPFRYDSSDEEEGDSNIFQPEREETSGNSNGVTPPEKISQMPLCATERFYFQENDPRLQEGFDFFGIKKTFVEMQEGFQEKRADLKLIIKAKVRNNKRRNRPLKKKLGGAKRHKKNMAMMRSKR